jgi:Flp pilus assembly protein TadG
MECRLKSWGLHDTNRSLIARLRVWSAIVRRGDGGALVEFALIAPLLLLIATGIFSLGTALYQKLQLTEAVSSATRFLASDRGDTDPCTTTTNNLYAAAPFLNRSNLSITYTLNGTSNGTGVTSCSGTTNLVTGGTAQITAKYPIFVGFFNYKSSSPGSISLQAELTEVVQ